jgi:hypothetical protein
MKSRVGPALAWIGSVPVTPAKPVTVRIALADASDGAFGSSVALLDGGTWSD